MCSRAQQATALPIIIFLQIIGLATGQFKITPPDNPVVGVIGNDAILPCQVEVMVMPRQFSVQWTFTGNSKNIDVVTYNRKKPDTSIHEDQTYRGRTNFFQSEINKGNVSLHLKNVMLLDKGKYTCSVFFERWYDAVVVDLEVAAKGDESSVSLDGHTGQGIGLTCKSRGWFPEPKVIWLNSRGQPRSEGVTTQSIRTSSGFFDVVSSTSVEPGSDQEVSCRVVNDLLDAGCESRVLISDAFFPSTSPWMTAFLVILCLALAVFAATGYKLTRSFMESRKAVSLRKKMLKEKEGLENGLGTAKKTSDAAMRDGNQQIDQLNAELASWESRSRAAPVTVKPDDRVLELRVPAAPGAESEASDPAGPNARSTVPVLVAEEGFAAGERCWEVAREDGRQEGDGTLSGEDPGALHSSRGEIFSSGGDGSTESSS